MGARSVVLRGLLTVGLCSSAALAQAQGRDPGSAGTSGATANDPAPLAALDRRVNQFIQRTLPQGDLRAINNAIRVLRTELAQVAQQSDVLVRGGGEMAIAAHVLRGEAHEHLAAELGRVGQLSQPTAEEQARFGALEASVQRLDELANHSDLSPEQVAQLRLRAQEARDRLTQARAARVAQVQEPFTIEVREERLRAIRRYAIAVQMARNEHVTTPFSSTALTRLRGEELSPLLEPAINGIPAEVRTPLGLTYSAGMYGPAARPAVARP